MMKKLYPSSDFQLLGSGRESVILTDNKYTYKIFDNNDFKYKSLLHDFKIRFASSRRFLHIVGIMEVNDVSIIKYDFEDSEEYAGGHEGELIEFLIECKKLGVVCWDVKPRNFRLFKDELKFIDYGWDIKPYNFKDFVFMVQRAYLCLKFPTTINFKEIAHQALTDWEIPELEGFPQFFNKVYGRALEVEVECKHPIKYDRQNEYKSKIHELINKYAMTKNVIIEHIGHQAEPIVSEANSIRVTGLIADLSHYSPIDVIVSNKIINCKKDDLTGYLTSIKKYLVPGGLLVLTLENPFFKPDSKGLNYLNIKTLVTSSGFTALDESESPYYMGIDGSFKTDTLILTTRLAQTGNERISLVIKVCYQDSSNLERQIRHIVSQCKQPRSFTEIYVVVDPKKDGFLRQYDKPSVEKTYLVLEELKAQSVIDEYYTVPDDIESIRDINLRWFNIDCPNSHSIQNIPVTPQLYAFEQAHSDYVLQADCDVMIGRRDMEHDFIGDMISALKNNPNAISVSVNIAHSPGSEPKDYSSPGNGEYKPEVRFCIFDKERLLKLRPFPNELIDGKLHLSWYQSIYEFQIKNGFVSLRGGDPRSFYVHPPNSYKHDAFAWLSILERIESGHVTEVQFDNFDLTGTYKDWCIPKREEPYIFIICGRNVSPAKFYRCWQSLISQSRPYWGAIIIDDASTNGLPDYIDMLVKPYHDKITFIKNPSRKGVLQNIYGAIKNYCTNPYSVIIILDADDMLIGSSVLNTIHRHYIAGDDMTCGSTIRMDKGYYCYEPDFAHPRNMRGGDVWLHIRTFRKYLFDRISRDDFIDNGQWIDKFTELTYMVPIVEMANHPHHIKAPLYLWEPAQVRAERHYEMNRKTLNFLMSRKAYDKIAKPEITRLSPPGEIINGLRPGQLIFIRHAQREPSDGRSDIISDKIPLKKEGAIDCITFGKHLPIKLDLIITSPALRTVQTAENIRAGNGSDCKIVQLDCLRRLKIYDYSKWRRLKNTNGWYKTITDWTTDKISDKVIKNYQSTISEIITSISAEIDAQHSQNVLIVSHNHLINLLFYHYFNTLENNVYHLHGFLIDRKDLLGEQQSTKKCLT
jgi:broad specificity phosphatase PhoE